MSIVTAFRSLRVGAHDSDSEDVVPAPKRHHKEENGALASVQQAAAAMAQAIALPARRPWAWYFESLNITPRVYWQDRVDFLIATNTDSSQLYEKWKVSPTYTAWFQHSWLPELLKLHYNNGPKDALRELASPAEVEADERLMMRLTSEPEGEALWAAEVEWSQTELGRRARQQMSGREKRKALNSGLNSIWVVVNVSYAEYKHDENVTKEMYLENNFEDLVDKLEKAAPMAAWHARENAKEQRAQAEKDSDSDSWAIDPERAKAYRQAMKDRAAARAELDEEDEEED
jgi:hypothetical protein